MEPHHQEASNYIDSKDFLRLRSGVLNKSKQAYEQLVAIVNKGHYFPRGNIRSLIQEIKDPDIIPIITFHLFYHGAGEGSRELIDKLSYFDIRDVQEPLVRLLKHPDSTIRVSALASLGLLNRPHIFEAIVDALEDPSPDVRDEAYTILSYEYIPQTIQYLIGALLDTRYFIIYKRPLAAKVIRDFLR